MKERLRAARARQKPRVAVRPHGSAPGEKTPPEPVQAEEPEVLASSDVALAECKRCGFVECSCLRDFRQPEELAMFRDEGGGAFARSEHDRHDSESVEVAQPELDSTSVSGVALALVVQEPTELELVQASPVDAAGVFELFLSNKAERTLEAYDGDLRVFAAWLGVTSSKEAVRQLFSLSGPQANSLAIRWLDSMLAEELSSATRARRVATLRSLTKLGRMLGAIDWRIEVQPPKVETLRDTRGPGMEQAKEMLALCKKSRDRLVVLFGIVLGMRREEIATALWADWDREGCRLLIRGKGSKEVWVTLPNEIGIELDRHHREWCLVVPDDGDDRIVGLTISGVRKLINRLGVRTGGHVRPHGLRHTAITDALDNSNGNIRAVQKFSRHSDPRTVMKYDDNRKDEAGHLAATIAKKLVKEKTDG